jgi:Zn-dependent metalloprotease
MQNLAKAGIEAARVSIQRGRISQDMRSNRIVEMETFTGAASAGVGKVERKVFDCENKWEQQVKLVRGEGGPVTDDDAVTKVYDYAGIVRKYFKEVLGRDSVDNLGLDLILNVHHGENYMNAFWDGDEMTFGDGDGKIFTCFAFSLDVVAHELSHGVTQFTANLEYSSQPGALNEHFSDVFGTAITQYAAGDANGSDWLIGDEIMGPQLYGEALRSMGAPGTAFDNKLMGHDRQPSHMNDYYDGPDDNNGVHINSGIPNKAFYLVSKELGTDKATLIWYTALQKLWSTAKFNDAVYVISEAARVLKKAGQVRAGATQAVRAAFKAVGLPHL